MGVAHLSQIITALVDTSNSQNRHDGATFPLYTPIAIIGCFYARSEGDHAHSKSESVVSRPPRMMVIGWLVLTLSGNRDISVLDEANEGLDEERVLRWLGENGTVG